jgi:hypothetical protein
MSAPELAAEVNRLAAAVRERLGSRIAAEITRRYRSDQPGAVRALRAALGIAIEQRARAHRDVDQLTIMQCASGCRAAKKIVPSGILEFACGKWFAITSAEVDGLASLAAFLENLQHHPRIFIVRGELIEGHAPGRVRRMCHPDKEDQGSPYFRSKERRHIAADLDSFPLPPGVDPLDVRAVAKAALALLPIEFRRASCWAQLTAGAGFKPGGRIRLWFWLSQYVSDAEAKRWLKGAPVDRSLYNPVQPHYTARPVFVDIVDPVPLRSAVITGDVDAVPVPASPEPRRPEAPRSLHGDRAPLGATRAEAYLFACVRAVACAPQGQGRDTCMRVALKLYGMAKAGLLDAVDITARLKGAMQHGQGWAADEAARGRTLADVNRQLQWAWDHAEPGDLRS